MTSAKGEPRGLGVSGETIRRWQDLRLIVSPDAPVKAERADVDVGVDQGRGRSQVGGFPPVVEAWLRTINVEPVDRSSVK
jgi:hypothetical protein